MKWLFCSSKASNNDEYKKVIKARMRISEALFIIGLITLTVALLAKNIWAVPINIHMLGVYTGVGVGFMGVSCVLWIKNKLILADDEKLKKSRLNNTDERIQEISNRAFKMATIVLLIVLYVVGLVGGIFYPFLMEVLLVMVCVFLIAYIVAYKMYDKTM
ncbi:DUF6442 family protein [Clostridium sp. LBM24168]